MHVLTRQPHRLGHLAYIVMAQTVLVAARDPHHSDHLAAPIAHRQLRGEKPIEPVLLVIPDLETVDDGFAAADDALVVLAVGLRDFGRKELLIHRPDEFLFALDPEARVGRAVRRDVAALVVLHEKEDPGEMLEDLPDRLRIGDAGEEFGLETR